MVLFVYVAGLSPVEQVLHRLVCEGHDGHLHHGAMEAGRRAARIEGPQRIEGLEARPKDEAMLRAQDPIHGRAAAAAAQRLSGRLHAARRPKHAVWRRVCVRVCACGAGADGADGDGAG